MAQPHRRVRDRSISVPGGIPAQPIGALSKEQGSSLMTVHFRRRLETALRIEGSVGLNHGLRIASALQVRQNSVASLMNTLRKCHSTVVLLLGREVIPPMISALTRTPRRTR